jgi:hypothetical protein
LTGAVNLELFNAIALLRRRGFPVALLYLHPHRLAPEWQQRADWLHVQVRELWDEKDF